MRLLLAIGISFLFPLSARAHEVSDNTEYRVLLESQTQEGEPFVVIVREEGHLLGQPYQVELRAACGSAQSSPMDWPVQDSFSVCDLSPESIKLNKQKSAVALKAKMVDLKNYEQQLELGVSQAQAICAVSTTVKKFSVRRLCPRH